MSKRGFLLLFDKDGVLIDTEKAKTLSYWLAIQQVAGNEYCAPTWTQDSYLEWHGEELTGMSRSAVVRGILKKFPKVREAIAENQAALAAIVGADPKAAQEMDQKKFFDPVEGIFSGLRLLHYNAMPANEKCRAIPAMVSFLEWAWQSGLDSAMVTQSELGRTLEEMAVCSIPQNRFRLIACADSILDTASGQKLVSGGEKSANYGRVKEILSPHFCWAIEDTDKGRGEALQAGIMCWQIFFPRV